MLDMHEVVGSIPTVSTRKKAPNSQELGAFFTKSAGADEINRAERDFIDFLFGACYMCLLEWVV